jgi:hypothetical protein
MFTAHLGGPALMLWVFIAFAMLWPGAMLWDVARDFWRAARARRNRPPE